MYHIYHTTGFILRSTPIGESNKLFYIYTEDFGNITAVAQGVRELKSKLRYSLQDLCMSEVSVVRGKGMWRITSAQPLEHYRIFFDTPEKKYLVAHIAVMLNRMLPGEEQNKQLFAVLENAFLFLKKHSFSFEDVRRAECIINLQILATLGYATDKPELSLFIQKPISQEQLSSMEGKETRAIKEINETLAQSQL